MVEDYKGIKHRLLLFESKFDLIEELRTELIQKNEHYYVFIFSALNYFNG